MASNTAERWWVRVGARWIARIDAVKSHLNLVFQGMAGISLASGALKYFGFEGLVAPFLIITAIGTLGYAKLYAEGGVWNQAARDKTDLSTNYSGPTMLMDARIEARQFAELGAALTNGEVDRAELEDRMMTATFEEWAALRDGVDVEEIEKRHA